MKAAVVLFAIGWAAVAGAATAPPEPLPYRADRYCVETAREAVVFFNEFVAGAGEKDLDDAVTMLQTRDFARGAILQVVVRRMYHGPHRLRTRRAVIDYTYHYCMDTPAPAATTSQ